MGCVPRQSWGLLSEHTTFPQLSFLPCLPAYVPSLLLTWGCTPKTCYHIHVAPGSLFEGT